MPIESLLLIVVVVEAVWILSSLFRNKEEEKARQQGRTLPRGASSPGNRPRPTPTNVDRFLEEMNRRRREAAERETSEARPVVVRTEVPRPAPRPRPVPRPVEVVVVPAPPAFGRAPVIIAAELPRPHPEVDSRRPETTSDTFVGSQVTTTFHGNSSSPGTPQAPAPSPANWILQHLQNRDMLRSAIILQQVLGPPISKRN